MCSPSNSYFLTVCTMQLATKTSDYIPIAQALLDIRPCDYIIDTMYAYCQRAVTLMDEMTPLARKIS
jgi:hypothetical protein